MSDNNLGAEGAKKIATVLLKNTSLTLLLLYDNTMEAEGAQELAKALSANISLTELLFDCSDEVAQYCEEHLRKNKVYRANTAAYMLVATRVILLPHLRRKNNNTTINDGLAMLTVEIWEMIVMYVGGDRISFSTKKIHAHGMNDKTLFSGDKKKFLLDCAGIYF